MNVLAWCVAFYSITVPNPFPMLCLALLIALLAERRRV